MKYKKTPIDSNMLRSLKAYEKKMKGYTYISDEYTSLNEQKKNSLNYTSSGHIYKQKVFFRFVENLMYLVYILYQIHRVFNEPKK